MSLSVFATNVCHMTGESLRFVLFFYTASKPLTGCDDARYAKCTRLFYKQCEKPVKYQSERILLYY